jgi:glycogen(starch) synthase
VSVSQREGTPRVKILHVLDRSVPNISGYSTRSKYVMEFQKLLSFEPMAITSPRQESPGVEVEHINELTYFRTRIPPHFVNDVIETIPLFREWQLMRFFGRFIEVVARINNVDLIHAHSPILCGVPAARAARRLGLPFVYEVRALWEDAAVDQDKMTEGHLNYRLIRHVETTVFRRSDAVITICEGLKNEVVARGIDAAKVFVIPNGVATGTFVPIQPDRSLADRLGVAGCVVIGFIGQCFAFEGLHLLLRAMQDVTRHCPATRLVIVGGGKEEAALRALSRDLGLDEYVLFTGRIPHAEISQYYSIMDILVYPRLRRRITSMVTPIKPLEAMSMERTVVASDVGGLKELVDDEATGLLFRAEDEQDLAAKLRRCVEDPILRRRLGAAARVAMMRSRDWKTLVAPYVTIYGNLVKNAQ